MTNKQHKAMWLEIAEAYYRHREEKTERQKYISYFGFCNALGEEFLLSDSFVVALFSHGTKWGGRYINRKFGWGEQHTYRIPPENKKARGDLAYLFSTMSKKEFEELVEVKYP